MVNLVHLRRAAAMPVLLVALAGCQSPPAVDAIAPEAAMGADAIAHVERTRDGRRSIDMGPPPPGYVRILGGTVPGWTPAQMQGARPGPTSPLDWEPIGPRPIKGEFWSGDADASGRVVSIAPHPVDPSIVYIASASGGIWKTTDAGANWTPLTDELSNLNHGAVVIDPSNPDTIYIGTGEYTLGSRGDGVFRSTDAGVTWERIATTAETGLRCSALIVDPTNPLIIHYAGDRYARSLDGGDTWQTELSGRVSSLSLNPFNPMRLFCGRHSDGVYRSDDGGDTWSKLTNGLPSSGMQRIIVAVAPSRPQWVYVAMSSGSSVLGTWRSTDGGDSWIELVDTPDFASPQAWYDMYVAVDPTQPRNVYLGGVSPLYATAGILRTINGGETWEEISAGAKGGQTHPDHHAMAFGPTGTLWEGNDGGVWKSDDRGETWINCNATLMITQQYTVGITPINGASILGGTQDNGSIERIGESSEWPQVIGGDGGFLAYDFENPGVKYTTYVYLAVQRWINGNFTSISGPWSGDPKNFIAPLVMDPNDSSTLLGGTNRVWRTKTADTSATWTALSGTEVGGGGTLNAIAVAPGAGNTIYSGSRNGQVWVTTNAIDWSPRSTGLPLQEISDIVVDPVAPGTAYVSHYATNGGRLYRTENHGLNWQNVTGDLPTGVGITALAIDWRHDPSMLYIGTGAGVWSSGNGGASWIKDEADLPNVNIGDLVVDEDRGYLVAGTFGRGTWRAPLPLSCAGDVDGNGEVEFDDLLAVLVGWGACEGCPADVNGDGVVEFQDLLAVLAAWGPCGGG